MLTKSQRDYLNALINAYRDAAVEAAFAGSHPPAEAEVLRLEAELARLNLNDYVKSITKDTP
jgi:hypothetical protein